jgi:large subunit ribosomal protein L30
MIIAIRISGMVNIDAPVEESLFRLRLRRKYSAVLVRPTAENLKLLQHLRNFIAYGDISKETLKELIIKRGAPLKKGTKIDADRVVLDLEKKDLEALGIKPFFRLHPPRGGADTKVHFPVRKGILGDNKEKINVLVRRML